MSRGLYSHVKSFHDDDEEKQGESVPLAHPTRKLKFFCSRVVKKNRGPSQGKTTTNPKSSFFPETHLHHHRIQIISTYGINSLIKINFEEKELVFGFLRPCKNLINNQRTIKNVPNRNERSLDFINYLIHHPFKPWSKNLRDDLVRTPNRTYRLELV